MENTNLEFGELVPASIRIQVYREAIHIIQSGLTVYGLSNKSVVDSYGKLNELPSYQLCILLPCILYVPDNWMDIFMVEGRSWIMTSDMFPEIKGWAKEAYKLEQYSIELNSETMNNRRIDVLTEAIYKIENFIK